MVSDKELGDSGKISLINDVNNTLISLMQGATMSGEVGQR